MANESNQRVSLGHLFEKEELELLAVADLLSQKLGKASRDDLPALDRKLSPTTLPLLGAELKTSGELFARARFLGEKPLDDPYGTGTPVELAGSGNLGLLELGADFGVDLPKGEDDASQRLKVSGSASGDVRYRHYLRCKPGDEVGKALRDLVTGSRLPNLLNLAELPAPDEVHRLDTKLAFDVGLAAEAGYKTAGEWAVRFAGGLSAPFVFDAKATFKASLGLSIVDRMVLAVGRADLIDPDTVRIRLQRAQERKLSFGATFMLDLHYDFGTGLAHLFEEMVDQVAVPRLVRTAREVTDLLASGDWDEVREKLTGEVAEVLDDLLDAAAGELTGGDEDWRTWLAGDEKLQGLQQRLRQVVDAYDGLEAEIQGLWERLLSAAELGQGSKFRSWLEDAARLASPDFELEDLLSGEARNWVDAIEALSGVSLEEMVSGGAWKQTVQETGEQAERALKALDAVPPKALKLIQDFAKETGIERTVEVLRGLDSPEALQQTVSRRIQRLAERMVGKAVAEIDADDLEAIQAWAGKVQAALAAPAELKKEIKGRLEQLELDYSLSISFEIERVSRTTSLLDVEVSGHEAHRRLRRKLGNALGRGDAAALLETLVSGGGVADPDADDPEEDAHEADESPPFRIRECAFTSERIRTSAQTVVFNLIGCGRLVKSNERGITRRLEQSVVRIEDAGGGSYVRRGRYSAGFQRGERITASTKDPSGERTVTLSTEASIWLVTEEKGGGLDLEKKYDADVSGPDVERSLRLSFVWDDASITKREVTGLSKILSDLGFQPVSPDVTLLEDVLKPGHELRFALEIRFPEQAVGEWLAGLKEKDQDSWNLAFLNASYRWAAENFVERGDVVANLSLGEMLTLLFQSPQFRKEWLSAPDNFFTLLPAIKVKTGGGTGPTVTVPLRPLGSGLTQAGALVYWILVKRGRGFAAVEPLADAWQAALAQRTPKAYRKLSGQFVRAWKKASVHTMRWPNSTFCLWLWIAGLNVVAPKLLQEARGLATLRWRTSAAQPDAPWSEPEFWTLPSGIPNLLARKVLPIKDAG
jgi:hypothetical protein